MRAVRFHTYGAPEVLRVEEVERPVPKGDEVLVRVRAASINNADIGARAGMLRFVHGRHLPHIPGNDMAGAVVECGPAVTAFVPGDHVFALLGLNAGGQAEYVSVAQRKLARFPAHISYTDAAAVPLAGLTALQGLRRYAHLRRGQRVLVNGASGGVGSYAVQLAKLLGCHVTGVCRGDKFPFVAELGADELIDYKQEQFTDRQERWDVVFDNAGADWSVVRRVLAPNGVMVAARGSPRSLLDTVLTRWGTGPRYRMFITRAIGHDLQLLAYLLGEGKLRPVVDRVFELDEVAEAHRYFEAGGVRGKVVVQV